MDDTEMVAQMLSMNSLQELQKMSKAMSAMSESNQFLSATNLIDKTVSYLDKDDKEQTGTVSGVTTADSKVYLTIGDASVEISKLVKVTATKTETASEETTDAVDETEAA
jgi:flagellar hook assembly protein FlgD